MAFTQDLFSSRRNYSDGNTRINQMGRIWYDSITHTLRIQLDNTPGGTIIGGGGGSGIALTDLSVSTVSASAGGSLAYNNTSGIFTYAPADLSNLASTTYVNTQINAVKDRIVSPNDQHITVIDNTGTTTSGGDILPGASTYNLGSAELPWNDVFVSKGSIIIADNDPNIDGVSISNTSKYLVIDRGGLKVTDNTGDYEIFQLDDTGKLILRSIQPALTSTPAVSLVGNLSGYQLPTTNLGVMLQATGTQDQPSRIYVDGVGTFNSANAYPAFIGRVARGTANEPLPIQAGDTIARFGGNAYGNTIGLNSISNVRVDMVATEVQSSTNRGTRIELWTTAIGSAAPTLSLHVDSDGIDLSEAASSGSGIIFKNGSSLKYWPAEAGNNGKILRTNGTDFFWDNESVVTGQVIFKGDWSAANPPSGGTPTISDATGEAGWQWIVSEAGTQDLGSGNITFAVGDLVIHNGTHYVKIDGFTPQVQSNWTETNSALPAYIKNKPTLATVATTGSYLDLSNRPSIPAAQVNSDWDATSGLAVILNKPTIPTQYTDTMARAAISLITNTPSGTTSTLTYAGGVLTFTSAAALISGTTIKTVNNNSLLGSGNVSVGTVTQVVASSTPVNGLSLSGGTITGSGTIAITGTLSGITNSNLSGTAGITNANLANSTISGISLGSNLATLTISSPLTGTSYNGSSAVSIGITKSDGSNDGYLSSADWTTFNNKQVALVSGTNIKTVNSTSLLGSGNLAVGTVTSVGGTGTVSGLTLTGTVTSTGNLTLGGTIDKGSSSTFGIVRVDGTTITATNGVISSAITQGITAVTPNTLNSTTHVVGNISGSTLTLSTDATTVNTPDTIVVRDGNGNINVGAWTVSARLSGINYAVSATDFWIGLTSKNITITLPNAAQGAVNGRQYQIADTVHSGNPGQTIAAASPATTVGNTSTSQQGQLVLATYLNGVWYCN